MARSTEGVPASEVQVVPIDSLRPDPGNPRRITERELERLKKALEDDPDFMRYRPILARPDGTIYAGNMRWRAAKALGWTEVPAVITDDPEVLVRTRAIRDNQQWGEWVEEELGEWLHGLAEEKVDLTTLGLRDAKLAEVFPGDLAAYDVTVDLPPGFGQPPPPQYDGGRVGGVSRPTAIEQDRAISSLEDAPAELQGALQLNEDVVYPWTDPMGVPSLREDMLVESLPENLDTWADIPEEDAPDRWWFYNYNPKNATKAPLRRCILTFFTYDDKFEAFWWNPAHYVGKMVNAGVRMAVSPDFSIDAYSPPVLNIYAIYRSMWLSRFMQDAGIRIIPRIPYLFAACYDQVVRGIPKHAPVMAFNAQTFAGNDKATATAWMTDMQAGLTRFFGDDGYSCDELLVYGSGPARELMAGVRTYKGRVRFLDNYLKRRRDAGLPFIGG